MADIKINADFIPIESGDGYIKYSDGTMICYGEYNITGETVADFWGKGYVGKGCTITFPQEFINPPIISISSRESENGAIANISVIYQKITTTNVIFRTLYATNNTSYIKYIRGSYIAIGKWK